MEKSASKGQHPVIGGKTIIGRIFAYQEKTGMSIKDIMRTPYIMFVLGMVDAPSIDYSKDKSEDTTTITGAQEQANALKNFLG